MKLLPLLLFGSVSLLIGQAGTCRADVIVTSTGTQTGLVARVDMDSVWIRGAYGEVPLPRTEIVSIEVPEPAEYAVAIKALEQGEFSDAIDGLKPLVDRVGGLSIPWVEDAVLRLGDAYAGAGEMANAKRVFEGYRRLYADSPRMVGLAVKDCRVLLGQEKFAEAEQALREFVDPLLAKNGITELEENALSEALLLLGDAESILDKPEQALDRYLAVVALFDVDAVMTAQAKFKAARIFEKLKKWDRAKLSYEELAGTVYADAAQRRLAALQKAHP